MERHEGDAKPVTAAMVGAGLWIRVGLAAAFAAMSAPLLVARDALQAGDGLALALVAVGLAWVAWRRARTLLVDDEPRATAPRTTSAPRRPATA